VRFLLSGSDRVLGVFGANRKVGELFGELGHAFLLVAGRTGEATENARPGAQQPERSASTAPTLLP
jgi:hypothetical protein